MTEGTGTLYLVATPIGNLEDITLRALRILEEVDIIACEDTRHTLKLLNHYEIKKPLTSYFEHNKQTKGMYLINKLIEGKNIALVTDAGVPGISDPGIDIVGLARENSIPVTIIPGACAFVSGLVLSGMPCERFVFEGFLPSGKKQRNERISVIKNETGNIVLYEAPHKLLKTLKDLYENLGDRSIAIARELTKKHEEVLNSRLSQALEKYSEEQARGEIVLVIDGIDKAQVEAQKKAKWYDVDIYTHVESYIKKGIPKKEAVKMAAADRGIPKRDVYSEIESKKEL
jgi:16S rRNA (cytidine1402-2'-O)-methyltransferase